MSIINNDTVVLITPLQLKYVNRQIISMDYLTKINNSILSANEVLDYNLGVYKRKELEYKKQIDSYEIAAKSYTAVIENKEIQLAEQIKQSKKDKTLTVIKAGAVGIIIGIIIAVL